MLQMLLAVRTPLTWLNVNLELAINGLTFWVLIYHYLALRRYFNEGRTKTFFKFAGLLILYFLLLMPTGFLLVLAITLLQV
jgi:hypothetical protein